MLSSCAWTQVLRIVRSRLALVAAAAFGLGSRQPAIHTCNLPARLPAKLAATLPRGAADSRGYGRGCTALRSGPSTIEYSSRVAPVNTEQRRMSASRQPSLQKCNLPRRNEARSPVRHHFLHFDHSSGSQPQVPQGPVDGCLSRAGGYSSLRAMPRSMNPWEPVVERIAARCRPAGLDLLRAFQVGWYNRAVEEPYRLPDLGHPARLGVLIGNTRALWAPFLAALRRDPARLDAAEPLDDYVMATVTDALRPLPLRWQVRWAHDAAAPVAMQRLAHVAGLAHLAPSHLSVHQVYGPWIALRAAVVIDTHGPPDPSCSGTEPGRRRSDGIDPSGRRHAPRAMPSSARPGRHA